MAQKFHIDGYRLLFATPQLGARIIELSNANKIIGQLIFPPDNVALPNPDFTNGIIHLFFHEKDFANVLNIVQNVKPLSVIFNAVTTGAISGLNTDSIILI